ncbi:hypothetical protein [Bradyrhizobium sp. HKCCYLR1023]|uniref:hypothetical protein n=1 Tax=Bradyrhizobium TaxID=374 RepID=UPI003EC015DF
MTTQSNTSNVKVGFEQGGARGYVKNGGAFDIESGGQLQIGGVDKTAQLAAAAAGIAAGYKIARGQQTTVTAADTVVTGLATVVSVVASLESDPVDNPFMVSAQVGDQAGAPAAGSIIIKTWQNTTGTDPTPAAATTFGKKVNWIAIGT